MTRKILALTVALALLVIPPHFVSAAKPGSGVTDLGTLGGAFSDAFGINNDPIAVRVVGWSNVAPRDETVHAFYWTSPGPMVDLGTLPGHNVSRAHDVNNHGQVAGESGSDEQAVLWSMDALGTWGVQNLGPLPGAGCASAHGINNGAGGDPSAVAVVGSSRIAGCHGIESLSHAVMWTNAGGTWVPQDLGTLDGDVSSFGYDVNDDGDVVGVSSGESNPGSGFLWTSATGMVRLEGLTEDGYTAALAINNRADVAGISTDVSGNRHAVRWLSSRNWAIEDLGTLGSGCCTQGFGINGQADVVGAANIGRSGRVAQHAFLAGATSASLVDLGSIRGSSAAWDLNDFGAAVGGSGAAGSSLHAVLFRLP
jgi:probable HAF family extracellular repeat protein